MIQAIGIMIGAYIVTRMVDLLTTDANFVVKLCALLTIVVTLICFLFVLPPH